MILIRTDANSTVATGHLMRCLSLADALQNFTDEEIAFCMADSSGKSIANDRGYEVIMLDGCWNDFTIEKDDIKRIIIENNVSLLIVDSYYTCSEYFEFVSKYTHTVYIDDRNVEKYDCDLLINYSIYAKDMEYCERYDKSKLLLGSKYAPLRRQFFDVPIHRFNEPLKKVLILSGGTDTYNFLTNITNMMVEKDSSMQIVVISGNMNKYYYELEKISKAHENVKVLSYVSEMAKYMCEADVAISACGTTIYELCACGTPMIGYGWTDNHKFNLDKYDRDRFMMWSGDLRDGVDECAQKCVENAFMLLNDIDMCREISKIQQKTVKGNGAVNMASYIYDKFYGNHVEK